MQRKFLRTIGAVAVLGLASTAAITLAPHAGAAAVGPANDNFSTRTQLRGAAGSVVGSLSASTAEPGEIVQAGGTVWYQYQSTTGGTLHLTVSSSATVRLFTGKQPRAVTDLTLAMERFGDIQPISLKPGQPVYLQISQIPGDEPEFTLAWTVDSQVTQPEYWSTPPAFMRPGRTTIGFMDDELFSRLVCQLDAAAPAPCRSPFRTPALTYGTHLFTVWVVDGAGNSSAPDSVDWQIVHAPANDAFAKRTIVGGASGGVPVVTAGATHARTDPTMLGAHTVWYQWIAAASGTEHFALQRDEPGFAPASIFRAALFTSTRAVPTPASLTPVATWGDSSSVSFNLAVNAGDRFLFGFSEASTGAEQAFGLSWSPTAPSGVDITSAPPAITSDRTVAVAFATADLGATSFECMLDGDAPAWPCLSALSITTRLGTHTLSLRRVDPAGNRSAESTVTWTVANTAPAPVTAALGATPVSGTDGLYTLTATVSAPPDTPTGTVHFSEGKHDYGTVALDASGHASVVVTVPPSGTFVADYSGDSNFLSAHAQIVI